MHRQFYTISPIAHIIHGGHRTAAIRAYSTDPNNGDPEQNFWLYNVLAPGLFFLLMRFHWLTRLSSHQHPSLCSSSRLLLYWQYSQKSLTKLPLLYLSKLCPNDGIHLQHDHREFWQDSQNLIYYKESLLRFKEVVPHLVWLLRAGGIWTVNCEDAYAALVKCCIEQVCQYHEHCSSSPFLLGLTGHSIYH